MITDFVDYFNKRKYGFNFFPVFGLLAAAVFASIFGLLYSLLDGSFRFKVNLFSFFDASHAIGSLVFGISIVIALHLAKSDKQLPLVFGGIWLLGGTLSRVMQYLYDPYFAKAIPLREGLLGLRPVLFRIVYAVLIAAALALLFRLMKRLEYILIFAFPAASLCHELFRTLFNVITGRELGLSLRYSLIEPIFAGVLDGLLFYFFYRVYMGARGWSIAGKEIKRVGDGSINPKGKLPQKWFFGFFLAVNLLCLLMVNYSTAFQNLLQFQRLDRSDTVPGINWLNSEVLFLIMPLLILIGLATIFVSILFVRRMWASIPDNKWGISPARAAGFLFIPVYNIYWMYRVFPGFAEEYNASLDRQRLDYPKLDKRLYIAFYIITLLTAVAMAYSQTIGTRLDSPGMLVLMLAGVVQSVASLTVIFITSQAVNRLNGKK